MKRIAIFCDGTWNRSDAEFQTNVVRASLSVASTSDDGITQQLIYIPGVGTGRGATGWAKLVDYVGGGLFGWGMTENIEEAYRHLAFSYEPGDEIYVFGFSRGAFTARSLCGLLRGCGIPSRDNVRRIPEAIRRYRSKAPNTTPDHEESFVFRQGFSPWLVTCQKELDWRQERGCVGATILDIAYLGVWDTVGALGIPPRFPFASIINRKYEFHDTALSRSVSSARHAVAIDERRVAYPPTLWNNLENLNTRQAGRDHPYRQVWFPGNHGAVGGGGDIRGLSNYALLWILEGAIAAGLWVDPAKLQSFRDEADFTVPLAGRSVKRGGLLALLSGWTKDRKGPSDIADVSEPAHWRWHHDADYRPATLSRVAKALDASGSSPSGDGRHSR